MLLILLCAVPALKLFVNIYLAQKDTARIYARDHVAEQAHAHLIEQLYKGEIPIENLLSGPDTEHPLGNHECEEALQKLGFNCKCTLKITKGNKATDPQKHKHYLCQLNIAMIDSRQQDAKLAQSANYHYTIYISLGGKRNNSHPHDQQQTTTP